jgi:O-antigen/teichoic acid export membrane protein
VTMVRDGPRTGSLGGAFLWLVCAYGMSLIGFLTVNITSARLLGVATFASFLVITTVAFVVGQLALFGVHRAGLRDVARIERADRAALAAIFKEGAAVSYLAVPGVAAVSALVYVVVAPGPALSTGHLLLGSELAVLICLNALQKLGANYLRGLGRLAVASFVDGSSGGAMTLVVQGLLLSGSLVTGIDLTLPGVLGIMAAGYLPAMLVVSLLLGGLWPTVGPRELFGLLRRTVHRYRVFALIQVIAFAGASLEIWLAALTLNANGASLFGAAQRLALMAAVPLTALQSVASPAISRKTLTQAPGLLEDALRTSATLALVGACAFAIPIAIWPSMALGLFFSGDHSGFNIVLIVLVLAQLINVGTGMCAPALTMTNFEGTVAKATTINLVLRVAIGLPAAIVTGAIGLAVTSTALSAGMWVYLLVQAKAKCDLDTLPTLRPSLASLRMVRG